MLQLRGSRRAAGAATGSAASAALETVLRQWRGLTLVPAVLRASAEAPSVKGDFIVSQWGKGFSVRGNECTNTGDNTHNSNTVS